MNITLKNAAEKLKAAEKILLTAHINPDGDAIGSTLALMQILRGMKKNDVIKKFFDFALCRRNQAADRKRKNFCRLARRPRHCDRQNRKSFRND